jgi:hypothetical protein
MMLPLDSLELLSCWYEQAMLLTFSFSVTKTSYVKILNLFVTTRSRSKYKRKNLTLFSKTANGIHQKQFYIWCRQNF